MKNKKYRNPYALSAKMRKAAGPMKSKKLYNRGDKEYMKYNNSDDEEFNAAELEIKLTKENIENMLSESELKAYKINLNMPLHTQVFRILEVLINYKRDSYDKLHRVPIQSKSC